MKYAMAMMALLFSATLHGQVVQCGNNSVTYIFSPKHLTFDYGTIKKGVWHFDSAVTWYPTCIVATIPKYIPAKAEVSASITLRGEYLGFVKKDRIDPQLFSIESMNDGGLDLYKSVRPSHLGNVIIYAEDEKGRVEIEVISKRDMEVISKRYYTTVEAESVSIGLCQFRPSVIANVSEIRLRVDNVPVPGECEGGQEAQP